MNATETPKLRCHILDTGYCLAFEHHMMQGGRSKRIACHSLAALLGHPQHGWLLWDTGYAPRMLEATRPWPFLLYRFVTPLRLQPKLAVANQLSTWGLWPDDVRYVIISHFHADHVAGLRDFPAATLIARQSAYDDIAPRQGFNALRRGFIPALLPDNFAQRACLLPAFTGPPLPALGPTHDLFDDNSLLLVELPGHARGQIGLLASTERGRILFAADGAWLTESIRRRAPPTSVANLIVDNSQAVQITLDNLHDFNLACPDVTIVPTHCPEAYMREVAQSAESIKL